MPFKFLRSLRRRWLARKPFPPQWLPYIERRLTFAAGYPEEERQAFLKHLKVFLWEKHWDGVNGLAVTEEMKVVVSGAAARLARHLSLDVYDGLHSVLIYEGAFVIPGESGTVALGEARRWGSVMLSWDAVRQGLSNPGDGHDTAMHEFAHVLDADGGAFDGTPELHSVNDYRAWAQVLSHHFFALKRKPHGQVLRAYGATNEAEFFAVATEAFFEKPLQLERKAGDLYRELVRYYRVDPAQRLREAAR